MKPIIYQFKAYVLSIAIACISQNSFAQITYDFESDAANGVAANVTNISPTTHQVTANPIPGAGNTLQFLTVETSGIHSGAVDLDKFPSASDYSVVWKHISNTYGNAGVLLRGQSSFNGNDHPTLRLGYLFSVELNGGNRRLRIDRVEAGGNLLTRKVDNMPNKPALGAPRWYKAEAIGIDLFFSYSDVGPNGPFTLVTGIQDPTYNSGTTQFATGGLRFSGGGFQTDNFFDDITYNGPQPELTYDTASASYVEAAANDGSIDNSNPIIINLTGDNFVNLGSGALTAAQLTIGNVPAGLTAVATITSATQLTITFTGNATAHQNADDVADLTFQFADAAFTNSISEIVLNSGFGTAYSTNVGIDFNDNPPPPTPGGVSTNLSLWLKANAGTKLSNTDVTSGTIDEWENIQNNSGLQQLTQSNSAQHPMVIDGNAYNFNPVVRFDGGDMLEANGINTASFRQTNGEMSVYYVTRLASDGIIMMQRTNTASAVATSRISIEGFALEYADNPRTRQNYNSNVVGNRRVIKGIHVDPTASPSVEFFDNGTADGIVNSFPSEVSEASTNFALGGHPDPSNSFYMTGDIAEFIIFNTEVTSTTARDRIESYLALKYGITLNNGTIDYLASDGSTLMWDVSEASVGFVNDIFGIGKDSGSDLEQNISKSQNSDAIVTLAHATVTDFTSSNTAAGRTPTSDFHFQTIANDGAGTGTWIAADANTPNGFQLLDRQWQVQEHNNTGGNTGLGVVTLAFDVADTDFDVADLLDSSNYFLVIDDDNDGDYSDETPIALTQQGNLWYTATAVDLTHQSRFTLATAVPLIVAPGGESDNLILWLKADAGTIDSLNNPTTSGEVEIWEDQSMSGLNFQAIIPGGRAAVGSGLNGAYNQEPTGPDYYPNYLNFNPGLNFDGIADILTDSFTLPNNNNQTIYIIARQNSLTDPLFSAGRGTETQFGTTSFLTNANLTVSNFNGGSNGVTGLGTSINNNADGIIRVIRDVRGGTLAGDWTLSSYFNGREEDTITSNRDVIERSATYEGIGASVIRNSSNYTGNIAEIIIYNGGATLADDEKIESYLAIKYGLTLDQDSGKNNYIASDSSIIWDTLTASTGFNNDIFGIGTDVASDLHQKISNSINNDALVIISLNDNFVATNQDMLRTDTLDDLNFLIIANNDSALDWQDNPSDRVFNCVCSYASGMKRIWEVTEVTTTGVADSLNDVYVGIPSNKLGRDSLPSVGNDPLTVLEPNRGFSTLYLLVDSNSGSDFTNNTFRYYEMELDSDGIYRTVEKVDLNDNDRFTFSFIRNPSRLRHGKDVVFDREIRTYRAGK